MIDDDDVENFAMYGNTGGGCLGFGIFVSIVVVLALAASLNKDECAKMTCPAGTSPKLTSHECLCVTRPAPPGGR